MMIDDEKVLGGTGHGSRKNYLVFGVIYVHSDQQSNGEEIQ